MAKRISIMQAKKNFEELARRIQNGESFVIVKESASIGALIPFDGYESMLETLDTLEAEPDILKKLKEAESEIKAGKFSVWNPRSRRKKPSARSDRNAQ